MQVMGDVRGNVRRFLLSGALSVLAACGDSTHETCTQDAARDLRDQPPPATEARKQLVLSVLTAADATLAYDRPQLVAGKYALMAKEPFAFFRGSLPLFLADWRDSTLG